MTTHTSLILCLVIALLHSATAQDTHVVLGDEGWTVPAANGDGPYRNWATSEDFEIGDTLVFNFVTGRHDVAEVTKAGYDNCSGASPISIHKTGPANITLTTSGPHYFICTITGHCLGGQKLVITVENNTDTPAPGAGTTPPAGTLTPSPPPPRSAGSVVLGGVLSALLSTVIAFVY